MFNLSCFKFYAQLRSLQPLVKGLYPLIFGYVWQSFGDLSIQDFFVFSWSSNSQKPEGKRSGEQDEWSIIINFSASKNYRIYLWYQYSVISLLPIHHM